MFRASRPVVAVLAAVAMVTTMAAGLSPAAADPDPSATSAEDKFTAEAMSVLSEQDKADFWIRFAGETDLSDAAAIADWDERGAAVVDALKTTATESQADTIEQLQAAGASFSPRWITNAILVRGGSYDLAHQIAESSAVVEIRETATYPAEEPVEEFENANAPNAVEWGVEAINADDVWSEYGVTGEGIVVANIDSGVDGDHPALIEQYRGYEGAGVFDNDYNYFDVAGVCGDVPCDTDGHGSHTMGTIAGSDGGENEIGVAPGSEWIAANGCSTCSDDDLIRSGEWILAPTDGAGENPDPSQRPHIVNNSWGSQLPSNDPFMEDVIAAWEAAGIFGTWSNGNSGPSCESSGSPGSRTITYSVSAFDSAGEIGDFSARGPGQDGTVKPDIAAPGVDIRSALADGTYGTNTGTSMAAPHLAGAIALLWSAAPTLVGDIEGTQALLDETALDVDDTTCGGTADDNNVWGEGRLDALALIEAAPTGEVGTLAGTVTDEAGEPIESAEVQITGPTERTVSTDADGAFSVPVSVGDYVVTASAFGYLAGTAEATVTAGETATVEIALAAADRHTVSGTVSDADGEPVAGATVQLDAPIEPVTTDADGGYEFADVPVGDYVLSVDAGGCVEPYEQEITVDGDETVDVEVARLTDAFGYSCEVGTDGYVEGSDLLELTGDDAATTVDLPFEFLLYGESYSQAYVSTNGSLNFLAESPEYNNVAIPASSVPNAAIYPFWDDLVVDGDGAVYTGTTEIDGEQAFVVEWRGVAPLSAGNATISFSIALLEDSRIVLGYGDLATSDPLAGGASATVGVENADGSVAHQFSYNEQSLTSGMSITYSLPPFGWVSGVVTDYNDGLPVAGATVTATPNDSSEPRVVRTGEDGSYRLPLFFGAYTVEISAPGYGSRSRDVIINVADEQNTFSVRLRTGVADVDPASFDWVLSEGETRTADLTITNSGSAPLEYEIGELPRNVQTDAQPPALSMGAQSSSAVPPGATTLEEAESAVSELEQAAADADTEARTAEGLYSQAQQDAFGEGTMEPDAAGDVLQQWATGLDIPWGVGFTGDVWISDPLAVENHWYTPEGTELGSQSASWGGDWSGDLAQNTTTGDLCQVNVGGDNGIVCFNPASGEETSRLTGSPWSDISQRGLAYNPTSDVFYVGGWNEGIIYTVAGPSHGTPGETLAQCSPSEPSIAGIAYNPTSDSIWFVPSSAETVIYQVSPEDCSTISTVAFPGSGEYPGAGLEMDSTGALWATDQLSGEAYLIDVGDPNVTDVPWLTVEPTSGTLRPGRSATLQVTVDTTGLEPGVYGANILVRTNAGRVPTVTVPVTVVVSAYQVAVNVGGEEYTDGSELAWSADQPLSGNDWGWVGQRAEEESTTEAIGGTEDDVLYQSRRTGSFSYVFDSAPAGTYEIVLGFAELEGDYAPGDRVFDVLVNGEYQLVALDVADDVGGLYADRYVLTVEHEGGDLEIELGNRRGYEYPILNMLSVTERGDLSAV